MKKPVNTFRYQQNRNMLRWLLIFCAVIVVGSALLLVTLPENRERLFGALRRGEGLQKKSPSEPIPSEAGLNGAAVVNTDISVRPISTEDHLLGEISAPVQLIVYGDFQCPFCARFFDTLEQARKEYGRKLVIAFRNYPLANHDLAMPAANAIECAAAQGKFETAYYSLFEANKAATLTQNFLNGLGATLELDEGVYLGCLTKAEYTDKIAAEKAEVKKLGVIGTPASFINGEYLPGAVPYEDFTYPDGSKGEGLKTLIEKKLIK